MQPRDPCLPWRGKLPVPGTGQRGLAFPSTPGSSALPDHFQAGWRWVNGCPSPTPARTPGPGPALCPTPVLVYLGTAKSCRGRPTEPGPVVSRLSPVTAPREQLYFSILQTGKSSSGCTRRPPGNGSHRGRGGNPLHVGDPSEPSIQPPPLFPCRHQGRSEQTCSLAEPPQNAVRQPVGGGWAAPLGLCGGGRVC